MAVLIDHNANAVAPASSIRREMSNTNDRSNGAASISSADIQPALQAVQTALTVRSIVGSKTGFLLPISNWKRSSVFGNMFRSQARNDVFFAVGLVVTKQAFAHGDGPCNEGSTQPDLIGSTEGSCYCGLVQISDTG
jgi:hypothetical protein